MPELNNYNQKLSSLREVMGWGFYFPNCQTCLKWKVGMNNLNYCGEKNCSKVQFYEERGWEWQDILIKSQSVEKQKRLDWWDDNAEKEGGFTQEEWKRIRKEINRIHIPTDPNKFQEFIREWKKQEKIRKKQARNTQDRHKDKYYDQNHYREQELIKIMANENWIITEKPFKKDGKFKDNLLIFPLKKWCGKNSTIYSYIYKTCFFLYDALVHVSTIGKTKRIITTNLINHLERSKNNNSSFNNSLQFDKENNFFNTKTNESEKDRQIIIDYSKSNNFHLFRYLFFHYRPQLSELLWKKPSLLKEAIQFIKWLITYYGQTKPWELVRLPKPEHFDYFGGCEKCRIPGTDKLNRKRPHCNYSNPHYQKGDLAYWLITCERAFLKTDNYYTPEIDVAKSEEQERREPWRVEALQQFQKLADYLGLPIIPSPSGGKQIQHRRIKGKEAINGSKLYYNSKSTNYNFEPVGEPRGKGQGVVHPLSKNYLPPLTEEFLNKWKKQQKRGSRYRFLTKEQRDKIYQKFGFNFNNQLPKKEKNGEQPIVRDSRNDLTDTSLSILNCKHLAEQKTINYDPWQINFLTSEEVPFREKKHLILNASHPYQRQLLTNFLKSDGSPFQFKLLQLSLDFHLQRWRKDEPQRDFAPSQLPQIPRMGGKIKVKRSAYGRIIEGTNGGNYQQVIYTGEDNQNYSVLFNCDAAGDSDTTESPFLDDKVGEFPTSFYLKAGESGSFIQPRAF